MPLTSTLREVILVEHFKTPFNLMVMDLAAWVQAFSEYPNPQQLPAAAPINLSANSPIGIQFVAQPDLPRLMLRSESGERSVQFQADRFAMGWTRTKPLGEPDEYPGYPRLRQQWVEAVEKFHRWSGERLGAIPSVRLVEIGYNNAALMDVDGKRRRLSEIFRWVQPGRPVNGFQVSWAEIVRELPDASRVMATVGLAANAPEQNVLQFNFTGFGVTDAAGDSSQPIEVLDALHTRILDMYAAAIISESGRLTPCSPLSTCSRLISTLPGSKSLELLAANRWAIGAGPCQWGGISRQLCRPRSRSCLANCLCQTNGIGRQLLLQLHAVSLV